MAGTVVRISKEGRETLRKLSSRENVSMQEVIERALEAYRRERFLEDINDAYANLRKDPKAWTSVQAERKAWESTLNDGLPANGASKQRRSSGRKARRSNP